MEEKNDADKIDDVMFPGFRFHPTDEELVGFYLKRKIQQRSIPIELIKQVDIYKYDPWDLPNLASTGEKEWYFYCPRDRKYRNSARPNRVTVAGFWKATGTDRPIYSSDGAECIGLKKSLVFYKGRAARGIKTDWMMHEFRLPSLSDSAPPKKFLDNNLPPNDAWAICRIFKKTNSTAQRVLSYSWMSSLHENTASNMYSQGAHSTQFSSENISCTSETGSAIQLCSNHDSQQGSATSFSALEIPSYRNMDPTICKLSPFPIPSEELPNSLMFSPFEIPGSATKSSVEVASMIFSISPVISDAAKSPENIDFGEPQQQFNSFSISSTQDVQGSGGTEEEDEGSRRNQTTTPADHWGNIRSIGFPFSLQSDAWKPNLTWESPNCPGEISTTYATTKCYT